MLLFIAGPYRADTPDGVEANIMAARAVAVDVWARGHIALCPHLNTAHFEDDIPDNDGAWLNGAIEMLLRCDGVVLLPNWEQSKGARNEEVTARRNGLPVYQWPDMP